MDKNYFKAPNAVFGSGLTKFELLVYLYLCRCQNNKEFSWPSYEAIARSCSMSRTKAIATVKGLIRKGLLEKRKRSQQGYRKNYTNLYKLIPQNLRGAPHARGSARHAPKKELINKNYKDTDGISPALEKQDESIFSLERESHTSSERNVCEVDDARY